MKKFDKLPYSDLSTIEFYDNHFIEITKDTKTEVKYNAIYNIAINQNKAIYIYPNAILAYIIPFNVFTSDDERTKFINFINEKTNKY